MKRLLLIICTFSALSNLSALTPLFDPYTQALPIPPLLEAQQKGDGLYYQLTVKTGQINFFRSPQTGVF